MGTRKKFTPEELKHLRAPPCTPRVTADSISRSRYYNWINSQRARENREEQDRAAFAQILEAYRFRGYAIVGGGLACPGLLYRCGPSGLFRRYGL